MAERNKKLFQLLKSLKGNSTSEQKAFGDRIAADWYVARQYVLRNLPKWELQRKRLYENIRKQGAPKRPFRLYLREGGSQFSMVLARQLSLLMHHPGFNETDKNSRTAIVFLYEEPKTVAELKAEVQNKLSKDEYLCNLIIYCDYTLIGSDGTERRDTGLPFLDIEFELRTAENREYTDGILIDGIEVIREELGIGGNNALNEFSSQDMLRGMMVNNAYHLGGAIDNLPSCDNATPVRYNIALDYLRGTKRKTREKEWLSSCLSQEESTDQIDLRNHLSCIFSADMFESYICYIMDHYDTIDYKYLLTHGNDIRRNLCRHLNDLARTEHARWNVEKLIMGFRPLNAAETLEDEMALHERNKKRKELKKRAKEPAHIDLTSYSDLERVNPQDLKYDHFIILAIPYILRKIYSYSLYSDAHNTRKAYRSIIREILRPLQKNSSRDYVALKQLTKEYFRQPGIFNIDYYRDEIIGKYQPHDPEVVNIGTIKSETDKIKTSKSFDSVFNKITSPMKVLRSEIIRRFHPSLPLT